MERRWLSRNKTGSDQARRYSEVLLELDLNAHTYLMPVYRAVSTEKAKVGVKRASKYDRFDVVHQNVQEIRELER
jgi:hypothetical protein